MIIDANPTLYEIEEMLEAVAEARDLDRLFPKPKGCTRAEHLAKGWCYLFYDESYNPLGYCVFTFTNGRGTFPFFGFMTTKFCKPCHMFIAARVMLKLMRSAFKQGVRVYIVNDRVIPLALKAGFKRSPRNKHIFFRR